jgi:transcriptional antiterminator NusG
MAKPTLKGGNMWYAVQVRTGQEEKVKTLCNIMIPEEFLEECFIPRYEKKVKYFGSWHIDTEVLFPGYIFMISEQIDDLRVAVKKIPTLTKILGDEDGVIALYEKEVKFLKKFGKDDHLIKLSQGHMENDWIVITDGPMKDFEGTIKKIDRHKRSAVIEVEFFGRKMDVKVGLEIVKKI